MKKNFLGLLLCAALLFSVVVPQKVLANESEGSNLLSLNDVSGFVTLLKKVRDASSEEIITMHYNEYFSGTPSVNPEAVTDFYVSFPEHYYEYLNEDEREMAALIYTLDFKTGIHMPLYHAHGPRIIEWDGKYVAYADFYTLVSLDGSMWIDIVGEAEYDQVYFNKDMSRMYIVGEDDKMYTYIDDAFSGWEIVDVARNDLMNGREYFVNNEKSVPLTFPLTLKFETYPGSNDYVMVKVLYDNSAEAETTEQPQNVAVVDEPKIEETAPIAPTPVDPKQESTPAPSQTNEVVNTPNPEAIEKAVTAYVLNVRGENNLKSKVLGTLKKGDVVAVKSVEKNWAEIEFNGQKAFVSLRYLADIKSETVMPVETNEEAVEVKEAIAIKIIDTKTVTANNLNIRSEANAKSKVVAKYVKGDTAYIVGSQGKWLQVIFNGNTGYIDSRYVE